MAIILARATLQHTSLLVDDVDVNDFVFASDVGDSPEDTADAIDSGAIVQGVYNYEGSGAGSSVAARLSSVLPRTGTPHRVDYYDLSGHLDGSPMGPPIKTVHFDLQGTSGTESVPAECAAVITLYGSLRSSAPVSIVNPSPPPARLRPKQSHTGRVFIGPLNSGAFGIVDGEVRIASTFATALGKAARHVLTQQVLVTPQVEWAVWSRKLELVDPIVGGAIDNAPDTQRRRGVARSARTTWSSTTP